MHIHANTSTTHPQIPSARPFPCLLSRAFPGERTPWAQSCSRLRYSVIDSLDGLAEMIQSIVVGGGGGDDDDDDIALYIYLHHHLQRPHQRLDDGLPPPLCLAVYPHPGERVFVVDLSALGRAGLEARQGLSLEQLRAGAGVADAQQQRQRGLVGFDVSGRLPSLRGLLESPAVAKVAFDARGLAAGLWERHGVAVRGVRDVQLMELAGRREQTEAAAAELGVGVTVASACGGGRARPRDLRTCLE